VIHCTFTLYEKLIMLKSESLSEALVIKVWMIRFFTDPKKPFIPTDESRIKVIFLLLPMNKGRTLWLGDT